MVSISIRHHHVINLPPRSPKFSEFSEFDVSLGFFNLVFA